MKKFLPILALPLFLVVGPVHSTTVSFSYTGSMQQFVVPNLVTSITVNAWGAQGQFNQGGVAGGLGGFVTGDLAVNAGDLLFIFVGGGGTINSLGGWNGGGNAGTSSVAPPLGGGGGGATDIRLNGTDLADRVVVAAGGGGAGGNRVAGVGRGTGGGGGGGYYGGGGGAAWPFNSAVVATGGSQTTGGLGGISNWSSVIGNNGSAGGWGYGGAGGNEIESNQAGNNTGAAGAAGGGLVGQNGAYASNFTGQSGAGGSSFYDNDLFSNESTTLGLRTGNGYLELIFSLDNPVVNTVSEPGSLVLLGLGLYGLGAIRRKQKAA